MIQLMVNLCLHVAVLCIILAQLSIVELANNLLSETFSEDNTFMNRMRVHCCIILYIV